MPMAAPDTSPADFDALRLRAIGTLQRGRIAIYLLYSFATLIALLIWVTR